MDRDTAYRLGYDCAKNGANEKNCNFGIFATRENKDAWERGAEDYTKKLSTMHKEYRDGSNHKVCVKCSFCITCGDCNKFGCGGGRS